MARQWQSPVDANKQELQNVKIHNLPGAPGSPVPGQLYFDTSTNRLYYWNGSAWANRATDADTVAGATPAQLRDRSTHTGTQGASSISDLATTVQAYRLDQFAVPTASVNANSQKIINLLTPTAPNDAATKDYVDQARSGISLKEPVRVATTSNITLSGLQTVDGVSLSANDRVLVKSQTTASENGIYSAASGAWTRTTDADSAAELVPGSTVWVNEGTTNADTRWNLTTNAPITVGTTSLTFTQDGGLAAINAGAGLTKAGNTLDIGQGTGITVAADTIAVDTSVVARKFSQVLSTSATSYAVTHNLGNQWVVCDVVRNSAPFDQVDTDIELTDANTVTVKFGVAPSANAFRVVVVG